MLPKVAHTFKLQFKVGSACPHLSLIVAVGVQYYLVSSQVTRLTHKKEEPKSD